jgi:D-psicose/D-tagatose/L-ribulose 3-epimerase
MAMKFGLHLRLWTGKPDERLLPALERVKQLGYDGVEFPIGEVDLAECHRWARWLDDLGLARTAANARGPADNPIDRDPAIRSLGVANNLRALDRCAALGVKLMAGPYHSALNHHSGAAATQDEWRWAVDGMRQVAEYAQPLGVMLAPEYVNRFECYLVTTAAEMVRFVRAVDHPHCRMLYDTFHANIEERDIRQTIIDCRAETIHVHISENDRGTPGTGHVDWETTFDTLRQTGYQGWMTIEAFGLGWQRHVWRRLFADELELARDGLAFMREHCLRRGMI